MFDISAIQLLMVLGIALLVLGPKKLPEMARQLGKGMRDFKQAVGMDAPSEGPSVPPEWRHGPTGADGRDDDVLDGIVVPGDEPPPGEKTER